MQQDSSIGAGTHNESSTQDQTRDGLSPAASDGNPKRSALRPVVWAWHMVIQNRVALAVASLIWLIWRSGTQPRRLAYPCQQVALFNVSAFFAGLVPALFLARKNVKEKAFLPRSVLFARQLAVAGIVFVTAFAAVEIYNYAAEDPNVPAPSNPPGAAQVAIVQQDPASGWYTQDELDAMVAEVVGRAGGLDDVMVDKDSDNIIKVVLKPNLVDEQPLYGITTHVEVMTAMIRVIKDAAYKVMRQNPSITEVNITIAEGSAGPWDWDGARASSLFMTKYAYKDCDYTDTTPTSRTTAQYFKYETNPNGSSIPLIDINDAGGVININGGQTPSANCSKKTVTDATIRKEYWLPDILLDCDVLISIPTLKNHSGADVTASMKNWIGTAPSDVYHTDVVSGHTNQMKRKLHGLDSDDAGGDYVNPGIVIQGGLDYPTSSQKDSEEEVINLSIVDLNLALPIDFALVDGLVGNITGPVSADTPTAGYRHLLLAGKDPVANDSVATLLMGYDPDYVRHLRWGWNREIGTMDRSIITVVGDPADHVDLNWTSFGTHPPNEQNRDDSNPSTPTTSLTNGNTYSGTIGVSASSSTDVVKGEIKARTTAGPVTGDWKVCATSNNVTSGTATIDWDTTTLPNGTCEVRVYVYDKELNEAYTTRNITLNNTNLLTNGTFDSNWTGWTVWHAGWGYQGDPSIDAGTLRLNIPSGGGSWGVYQTVGVAPGNYYQFHSNWKGDKDGTKNWYEMLILQGGWDAAQADNGGGQVVELNYMYGYDNFTYPLPGTFSWIWAYDQDHTDIDWNNRDGLIQAQGSQLTVVLKCGADPATTPTADVWFDNTQLSLANAPPSAEICNNGVDDDGDTFVDCCDVDCVGEPNCLAEGICDDGLDDDCDGDTDCDDSDCDSDAACHENGATECSNGIDDDGDGLTDCCDDECAGEANCLAEGVCDDGFDDDCDGQTDCDDTDCDSDPVCHETGATACSNGLDDDGDGLTDCCDDECAGETNCLAEGVCDDGFDDDCDGQTDCADSDCDSDPICHETGATACSNGLDDDGDGLTDCCDDECLVETFCGAEICDDTIDNDCDGLVDCADTVDCPEGVPPCDGFTLTITPVTGGSTTGAGPYPTGTEISIEATADGGYHFVNWTGDLDYLANTTAASTTITLFNNYTIQANFASDVTAMYEVYTSAMPGGSVTAPASSPQSYAAGTTSIAVTAAPDSGYSFDGWVGDTGALANPSVASTTITVLNGDVSVQAKFLLTTPDCGTGPVEHLVNGNWSSGATGWTQWFADWADDSGETWTVDSGSGNPAPSGKASFANGKGSFGWYQKATVDSGTDVTVSADWAGNIGGAGWGEVMLFTVTTGTSDATIVSRIDTGNDADITYKKDSWGINPPTSWSWQDASSSPHPGGNSGTVNSLGVVVVALKTGSTAVGNSWTAWDNLSLISDGGTTTCDPPTAACQTIVRPLGPDGTVTVCAAEIAGNSTSGTPACCGLSELWIRRPANGYADTILYDVAVDDIYNYDNAVYAWVKQDDDQGPVYCEGYVNITNGDPSIEQGASASLIVDEDSNCPLTDNEVYLTATDPEGHALTWSILSGPSTGSASFVGGVDTGGSVTLCYDPNDGQTASDSFQVEVADIAGATDTITVNVSVTPASTCQKPVLTGAVSRKTHLGAGDWDIDVGIGDIESRSSQLGTANPNELLIVATFDINVALLGGSDVTTDVGTVFSVVPGATNNELEITITDLTLNTQINLGFGGVVDANCPTDPAYASNSTLCVRVIVGDYDNFGRTNYTDFSKVKAAGYINQLVDSLDKARADFDCSGRPNYTDFARVKNAGLINQTAPACPVPPIGP